MKQLHKEDIEELDYIINACLEKGIIDATELRLPNIVKITVDEEISERRANREKIDYYKRFFVIIRNCEIAIVSTEDFDMKIESIYPDTNRFIEDGSFKKLYEVQLQKEAYQKTIEKGNIASATNSIWTKKTYWWTFGFAIAGLIIALWALFRTW